ncbi:MAG: cytochrome c oxidase assembly protein [Chloroflexi bacterium]|nr:cytochrome c oxidase assembly protein [Chloroflexota bacterium]
MQVDVLGRLAQASIAAHDGVHEGQSVWERWNVDPELLIPVLLFTGLYLRGVWVWRQRSREHARWRTASYLAGMAILVLAIESPLDALAEHHFTVHMIQHELLMMFVAPLILLGAPTTPVLRGMPRGLRRRLVRPLASNTAVYGVYRFVTHPLVGLAAFTAILWAWHVGPGWYDAAIEHELLHKLQHISFTLGAVLLWWNVIDPKPLRSRMSYVTRMGFLVVASTPKSFLGALIVFANEPLYDFYSGVEPILALTPLEDQELGGTLMWVPSQMMFLVAVALVFAVWAHKAEQRQRVEDAERLSARLAEREAQATGS